MWRAEIALTLTLRGGVSLFVQLPAAGKVPTVVFANVRGSVSSHLLRDIGIV